MALSIRAAPALNLPLLLAPAALRRLDADFIASGEENLFPIQPGKRRPWRRAENTRRKTEGKQRNVSAREPTAQGETWTSMVLGCHIRLEMAPVE